MPDENNPTVPQQAPLQLFEPDWSSPLVSTIVELEKLRVKRLDGPVPPRVFFQLKEIFQFMESLGSARIEGNRTTLAEYIEEVISRRQQLSADEKSREIENLEKAINFIDENIAGGSKLEHRHVLEVHRIIVDGLTPPSAGEGSRTPGAYRNVDVTIRGATHKPPLHIQMREYMDELLEFVNRSGDPKNDLLVTAVSHHRFVWIHPFDNGNGRMARMFTYAMLVKQGFRVSTGRILNPTAIFCMDRDRYNALLSAADGGTKTDVLAWCDYVLSGLRKEIEKVDHLLDRSYLIDKILYPAVTHAKADKLITDDENSILRHVIGQKEMTIRASDLDGVLGHDLTSIQRTRIIGRLKEKRMLEPFKQDGRIYTIGFVNSYLLRGVMRALEDNGFVPASLNKK